MIQSHLLITKQRESKPPACYLMFLYVEWFPTGPGVHAPQVVGHPVGPESPRRTEKWFVTGGLVAGCSSTTVQACLLYRKEACLWEPRINKSLCAQSGWGGLDNKLLGNPSICEEYNPVNPQNKGRQLPDQSSPPRSPQVQSLGVGLDVLHGVQISK